MEKINVAMLDHASELGCETGKYEGFLNQNVEAKCALCNEAIEIGDNIELDTKTGEVSHMGCAMHDSYHEDKLYVNHICKSCGNIILIDMDDYEGISCLECDAQISLDQIIR